MISGCDTGFGRALAEQLQADKYRVVALCLTRSAVDELGALGVEAVLCDVTNSDQLEAARVRIAACTDNLHAVVCNAGISRGSLFDWSSLDEYRATFEVNFFSGVALTKLLWPMLLPRAALAKSGASPAPRIVNMTSIADRVTAAGMSSYAASKHAFASFSDALRMEVEPFGVKVCIIEPGAIGLSSINLCHFPDFFLTDFHGPQAS